MALNSFLSRVGEALRGSGGDRAVVRFFSKQLGSALARRIASYVDDGEASSVLSDCAQQNVINKWRQRHQIWPQPDEGLFNSLAQWSVDQMMRVGEVLAVLDPITHDWGQFGTRKSPDWLRHVATLWLGQKRKGKPVETLVDLSKHGGLGTGGALEILFSRDPFNYRDPNCLERFAGVDEWLRDHAEAIGEEAIKASADVRVQLSNAVGRYKLQDLYLPFLLDLATGTAKGAREAAIKALTGSDVANLQVAIEDRFGAANPTKRALLVDAMAATMGDQAEAAIGKLREGETSTKVLAAMDRVAGAVSVASAKPRNPWQKDGAGGFLALDGEWVNTPAASDMPGTDPIPDDVLEILTPHIIEHNERVRALRQQHSGERHHWSRYHKEHPVKDALKQVKRLTSGTGVVSSQAGDKFAWFYPQHADTGDVDRFLDHPSVNLRHLVRLGRVLNGYNFSSLIGQYAGPPGLALQRRLADGADIRIISQLWREAGGKDYLAEYLSKQWYFEDHNLPAESWPLILAELGKIDEALGLAPQQSAASYDTLRALKLLELMPKVPERYRGRLMILANESGTRVRERARKLLADAQGIEDAIALQLDDGKQDVRALAAQWLAQRGATSHIPVIRRRLKKERSDKARAQMITALDRLGDDTSDFFDQKAMVAEAEKALKKAMPKGLDWFPFEGLPKLNWADGKPVDPILPRHWVVLSTRLKEPGGNALIDLWLDRLAPGEAHKLGWMILTGWIAQDTRTPSDEEANQYALSHVDQQLKYHRDAVKRWPEGADYYPTDYDTVFAQLKRGHGSIYLGSAADSKGMLALASRVEGSDAGPRIRAFLKDHGSRTSQAKALLDVLANIGTPAALQVLLQTADRLKQKSVQAHAARLIEEVADRRGWTAGELADRTVPTGGLDEDGVLVLECGPERTYTARLDEEDKLALFNAAGKEVKALPAARIEDEKAEVAASKKALSKARKEVKQVVSAQTDRFREAMCMERTWSSEDWTNYVASHPIVGRLAARLVWIGLDKDGEQVGSFRPLGDGSFTDVADEDIDPAEFEQVKLAHSTLLDGDTGKAWTDHFSDYDVKSLFDQLGRSLPDISDDMRKARVIKDREGWMIETFRLRTIATKLGYQRGPSEDGGWFMTYHRVLREAKLVAEIEFTGSMLPEENIAAALISLQFRELREDGRFGAQVSFDKVPDVLLAETWRDYRDMAEHGSGFDADWQKKSGL